MVLRIKKIRIGELFLPLYLFLCIYAPPFLSVNTIHIIAFFSLLYVLAHMKTTWSVFYKSGMKWFYVLIALLTICFIVGSLFELVVPDYRLNSMLQIYLIYQSIVLMVEISICSLFLCCIVERFELTGNDIIRGYLIAGLIEFFFVAIAYISPDLRREFLALMGKNTGLTLLYTDYSNYLSYRGYGFALELLDTFGYGTGIIAGLAFVYRKKSKLSYVVMACTLIATLLNSRTGLIVFALFAAIDLYMGNTTRLTVKKALISVGVVVLGVLAWFVILPTILTYIFETTSSEIIKNTVRDLRQVLQFKYHTLRPEMWKLPEEISHMLFGTGHLVNSTFSTVGYVNALWAYGLVGCTVLYCFVIKMYRTCLKQMKEHSMYYNIVISLLILFFVIQLKMPVFTYSAGGFSQFSLPFILTFCATRERFCEP